MKHQKILMGMTVIVEIADQNVTDDAFDKVFAYLTYVDEKFSTYKDTSEISKINKGLIKEVDYSSDMREVFKLSEETKQLSHGYFDIRTPSGIWDPSGLVKGWAINNAARILLHDGFKNFYIDAGGDIQACGKNEEGEAWSVGIRSPFNPEKEIIKVLSIEGKGVATSGTYVRGEHIYNPHVRECVPSAICSLTVVGPNVYEADRFATAAFAMGKEGISFIESLEGFEGYSIDNSGLATMTSNFETYVKKHAHKN